MQPALHLILTRVYDKYCDSKGSIKNVSAGLDIVSSVVSIGGKYGSSEEAMQNFCRDYSRTTDSKTASETYSEKIVTRAYDSFDTCVALAATGVIARPTIESMERVNFFLAPGYTPVEIRGVSVTSNISCKGQDPSKKTPQAVVLNEDLHVTLAAGKSLSMVCTRSAGDDGAGNRAFDEGVITIMTDARPRGNFVIFMPRDTKLAPNQASALQKHIADLTQANQSLYDTMVKGLNQEFAKLDDLGSVPSSAFSEVIDISRFGGPQGTKGRADPMFRCSDGHSFIYGITAYVEDETSKLTLYCRSLPKLRLQ